MTKFTSTIAKVQQNMENIIKFLEPQRQFLNCHFVTFLCDNLWEKFIDETIRSEINTIDDVSTAYQVFFEMENARPELLEKHKNLFSLIQTTKQFYMENIDDQFFISTHKLFDILNEPVGCLNLTIPQFMKVKKNHEVEISAKVIAALVKSQGKENIVIDVGDGKGYLSSRLSLEYQLSVLGVEGNPENTKTAEQRNQQLSKVWKSLVKRAVKTKNENVEDCEEEIEVELTENNSSYKTTSQMIFADTPDLVKLAATAFPDDSDQSYSITGLHTCGNLASNSMKQFAKNDQIKMLCNVGCCYHLLYEEFETDYFNGVARIMDERDEPGFPMSNFLRDKGYKIGRNCRMIATQSYKRVITNKTLPDESLIYRALVEKIIRQQIFPDREPQVLRVGKMRYKSFDDYLRKFCKKFDIHLTDDFTTEKIQEIYMDHQFDHRLINLMYLIRLLYAKIVETLILLDRYLFLLEKDFGDVFLVKMFDEVVSPRNYGLIAIKK